MKKILLILPLILITSCGYDSYNECVKEEIRKNDGKNNTYIQSYCREKFPSKISTTSSNSQKKYYKLSSNMNDEITLSWTQTGSSITVTIRNNSTNKTVRAMRAYFANSSDCGNESLSLDRDDYQYKLANIGPLQTGTLNFYSQGKANCMFRGLKGE